MGWWHEHYISIFQWPPMPVEYGDISPEGPSMSGSVRTKSLPVCSEPVEDTTKSPRSSMESLESPKSMGKPRTSGPMETPSSSLKSGENCSVWVGGDAVVAEKSLREKSVQGTRKAGFTPNDLPFKSVAATNVNQIRLVEPPDASF